MAEKSIKALLEFEPKHIGAQTAIIVLCIKNKKYESAGHSIKKLSLLNVSKQLLDRLQSKLALGKGNIHQSVQLFPIMSKENKELRNIVKSLHQEMPAKNKKIIERNKNQLYKKPSKENKDWFDLSLLSLFEGKGEEAMSYLEKAVD